MEEIYLIVYNNGEAWEDYVERPWGYVETEEEAERKCEELNKSFKRDQERYRFLDARIEQLGADVDSETLKEYQELVDKYPSTHLWLEYDEENERFFYMKIKRI